jgi:hypothetical protein
MLYDYQVINMDTAMKNFTIFSLLVMLALAGCDKLTNKPPEETATQGSTPAASLSPVKQEVPPPVAQGATLPPGHPAIGATSGNDMQMPEPVVKKKERAKVLSHIDIPQFTYLEVNQNGQTRWLAATTVVVKDGDTIEFVVDSIVDNFTSKALKRTFKSLSFVNHTSVVKGSE